MRLLLLGSDNLAQSLRELGADVFCCGPGAEHDLPWQDPDPDWRELREVAKAKGLTFDAIIVTDHLGARRLPTGLWAADPVTVFWGLDAPLNQFWQNAYARLFDLVCLDQPAQARSLAAQRPHCHWLPVGVDPALYEGRPAEKPRPEVCFVGVVNPAVRPKRSALLDKVGKLAPLRVRGGRQGAWFSTQEAAQLYRTHQVVLNENLFPGVTTRPLEGMAAGGFVLSESAPGAMDMLFQESTHLEFFDPASLEHKLELALKNPGYCRRLASQGREMVCQEHSLGKRAQFLLKEIEEMSRRPPGRRPRAQGVRALHWEGQALLEAGLRWPHPMGPARLQRALGRLQATGRGQAGSLPVARALGRAWAALGHWPEALAFLDQARELGRDSDDLAWSLAALQGGRRQAGLAAWRALTGCAPPGDPANFHLQTAQLLISWREDLTPGFNRLACPQTFWGAFEHLLEAVRLEPGLALAWETLGDLLLERQAPNQAYDCFQRAMALGSSNGLAAKTRHAAQQGYIS